ncbi:MAG: cytochrome c3 family protein [Bacteroidota bacterium]
MNISYQCKTKGIAVLSTLLFFLLSFISSPSASAAADGKTVFKACAACHAPDKEKIGPALKDARKRWKEAGLDEAKVIQWVQNPAQVLGEGNPYVKNLVAGYDAKGTALMTPQPFAPDEIKAALDYADSYVAPSGDPKDTAVAGSAKKEEGGGWMWIVVLSVIFLIIAASAGSVRRQLVNANREKEGQELLPDQSYWQIWCGWAWRHKVLVGVFALFFVLAGMVDGTYMLMDVGVYENYKPDQPINFPHDVHAGQNKIACQYCHSSVEKSRHAGLPSPMLCMNCHKNIQTGTRTGENEIAKIYKYVGFDPKTLSYSGKTENIKWIKVHNLPDHVFFSHQQHVVVGKLDCSQCHGDMTKEGVARIMPHQELHAMEKNKKDNIKVTRATLTMGWCIECHNQKAVVQMADNNDKNGYYIEIKKRLLNSPELLKQHLEDDKITVAELGGWECAKCHY